MARVQSKLFAKEGRSSLLNRAVRLVAFSIVVLLTFETTGVAAAQQNPQQNPPASPTVPSQSANSQSAPQPAAPPKANTEDARNESPDSLPSAPTPMPPQEPVPQQPTTPQQPVGTAAAPYEKPTGVPGSRPAGAAIAPAKQRRVRAIVIRVGIVLAAGVAVGTVVGLSKATHSSPQ